MIFLSHLDQGQPYSSWLEFAHQLGTGSGDELVRQDEDQDVSFCSRIIEITTQPISILGLQQSHPGQLVEGDAVLLQQGQILTQAQNSLKKNIKISLPSEFCKNFRILTQACKRVSHDVGLGCVPLCAAVKYFLTS